MKMKNERGPVPLSLTMMMGQRMIDQSLSIQSLSLKGKSLQRNLRHHREASKTAGRPSKEPLENHPNWSPHPKRAPSKRPSTKSWLKRRDPKYRSSRLLRQRREIGRRVARGKYKKRKNRLWKSTCLIQTSP